MALNLHWNKCQGDVWCDLLTLNLDHEHFNDMGGVYIVWHGGPNAATVRVGQGFIRDRLAVHREDTDILVYQEYGLLVTWARIAEKQRDGVERYLAEELDPKVSSHFPELRPIEVNVPWCGDIRT